MKPIRTAILARVSHDEQAKFGFSIENQLDRLRTYAKENNLLIVDEYVDEGYSAGTTKRPELQRLLSELDKFELVIFTRLDRFSRNVLDANEMVNLFFRNNVSIRATDEEINTQTADGMFEFNLRVSLAQRELAKGSERINTVFDYKVKNGHAISGSQPLGYMVEKDKEGVKRVVKNPKEAPIVEDMFKHFFKYQSIRATTLYINAKYGLDKGYRCYNRMFKNEKYSGKFRNNPNYCPAYITQEQFQKAQDIIEKNIKTGKTMFVYLFSGMVTCDCCGSKMIGNASSRPNVKPYFYYRCSKSVMSNLCNRKGGINEQVIENYLLENIDSLIEEYVYKASVKADKQPKKLDIKDTLEEIDRLNYQFRKKRISEKEYDEEYELLEAKLKNAENQAPKEIDTTSVEAFLNSGWKEVYHSLKKEDKRALFRSVIKDIRVDNNKGLKVDFF